MGPYRIAPFAATASSKNAFRTPPHIARLLDGGTTPEQIPFFALEFVDGVPIDRYVEANWLPFAQRIRLFLQVCDAVEYAHEQLVIHRDLKPGNILVADGFARLPDC